MVFVMCLMQFDVGLNARFSLFGWVWLWVSCLFELFLSCLVVLVIMLYLLCGFNLVVYGCLFALLLLFLCLLLVLILLFADCCLRY